VRVHAVVSAPAPAVAGLRQDRRALRRADDGDLGCGPGASGAHAPGRANEGGPGAADPLLDGLVGELRALLAVQERLLGRRPGAGDRVFLSPEGAIWPVHTVNLMRIFDRVFTAASIEREDGLGQRLDIQALRHTAASRLARAGVGLVQAQRLLGHSDPKLTARASTPPGGRGAAGGGGEAAGSAGGVIGVCRLIGDDTNGAAVRTPDTLPCPLDEIRFDVVPHPGLESEAQLCIIPVVGGLPLPSVVEDFELRKGYEPAVGYSGIVPANFRFGSLADYYLGAPHSSYWQSLGRIALLGCADCGEVGCWPLYAEITLGRTVVKWGAFEQPHRRDRDYTGLRGFAFDRVRYEQAVRAAIEELDDPDLR
jgi:hypothetical protein